MDIKEAFKQRLRELRAETGETQAQVGEAIGLRERHYQNFERGVNFPSFMNLLALADHFDVSLDYLMCRTDKR